jgi:hypothetical protein
LVSIGKSEHFETSLLIGLKMNWMQSSQDNSWLTTGKRGYQKVRFFSIATIKMDEL